MNGGRLEKEDKKTREEGHKEEKNRNKKTDEWKYIIKMKENIKYAS